MSVPMAICYIKVHSQFTCLDCRLTCFFDEQMSGNPFFKWCQSILTTEHLYVFLENKNI